MQAKRFIVPNMREGLKTIREVLGSEAMIISNQSTEEGLEIIAGIPDEPELHALSNSATVLLGAQTKQKQDALLDLYKEKMIDEPLTRKESVLTSSKPLTQIQDAPSKPLTTFVKNDTPKVRVEEVYPQKDVLATLTQELSSIRQVLSSQVSDIAWKNYELENAFQSQVVKTLMQTGISKTLAVQVARQVYQSNDIQEMTQKAVHMLANEVIQLKKPFFWDSKIKVIIGPGGSGKTKTIGKCLSTLIEQYDAQDIALVSFNEQQLGQFDELLVYANIFNMAANLAVDMGSLDMALNRFKDKKVTLIDLTTADVDTLKITLELFQHLPFEFEFIGLLPTVWETESLNSWLQVYAENEINHIIATKMDETANKGKLFDILIHHQLSIQTIFESPKITEGFKAVSETQLINYLRDLYEEE